MGPWGPRRDTFEKNRVETLADCGCHTAGTGWRGQRLSYHECHGAVWGYTEAAAVAAGMVIPGGVERFVSPYGYRVLFGMEKRFPQPRDSFNRLRDTAGD